MIDPRTSVAAELQRLLAGFQQAGLGYLDYLNSRPAASDEAVVRFKIAEPLLAALGYDLRATSPRRAAVDARWAKGNHRLAGRLRATPLQPLVHFESERQKDD